MDQETPKFRTAVLVVHGMGSQRPLSTVRGIVDAVWFDDQSPGNSGKKRIWTHPEPSGVDIDLTVMTTNKFSTTAGERTADFHELYWAHLMSETKAVAVLLWLFELARKGPNFTTALNALWHCVAIYLCLLLLSVSLLTLQFITRFADIVAEPYGVPVVLVLMILVGVGYAWRKAPSPEWPMLRGHLREVYTNRWTVTISLSVCAAIVALWCAQQLGPTAAFISNVALAPGLASGAAALLMGWPGMRAMRYALTASLVFFAGYVLIITLAYFLGGPTASLGGLFQCTRDDETLGAILCEARLPWSLTSKWSGVAAWAIIGLYLAINAAFLQPFLGDAARYFRNSPANIAVRREIRKQAVDTLDMLHRVHLYDRIIIVAHSLGSVVAYDMLRAYYSRICDQIIFEPGTLQPEFDEVNGGQLDRKNLRNKGRELIRKMALNINLTRYDKIIRPGKPPEAWLVTDFVTLGSPLTHARYLMCNGENLAELGADFERRLEEREFPSCPPTKHKADPDGWLAFKNPKKKDNLELHHGGLFAVTRWTNLYFPMSELFWGDGVGGPVGTERDGGPLFGTHVKDVDVCISKKAVRDFFTHTAYWDLTRGDGHKAPHIQELIAAINLADEQSS